MSETLSTSGAWSAATAATDYARRVHVDAAPEEVFAALTTLSGLAGWWTAVSGVGAEGGELRFTFNDENPLVIHVDSARRPSSVIWSVRAWAPCCRSGSAHVPPSRSARPTRVVASCTFGTGV